MKKDYKTGDSITVIKPGMFKDLPGTILSNNTDTQFKPLSIILLNGLGTWQMNYEDVTPTGKEKPSFKADVMPWEQPEKKDSIDNLTVATKPAKRPYSKRGDKAKKEVKPKRKYERRAK